MDSLYHSSSSYFTVLPAHLPAWPSIVLNHLIPFTEYELLVKAVLDNGRTISSHKVTFDTSSKWSVGRDGRR